MLNKNEKVIYRTLKNSLIKQGRKPYSEQLFAELLCKIKVELNRDPLEVIYKAVENVRPRISLRKKVMAGTTYMLPWIINETKSLRKGVQWILSSVGLREEKNLLDRLFLEIKDSYNKRGFSMRKKYDYHKKGWSNRAFIRLLHKK